MQSYSIKSIQFGLLDPKLIQEKSVCEIKDPKDINDIRMMGNSKKNQNESNHPGNFGHIKLAKPVFHVGFIDLIRKILVCVCYNCKEILINDYDKFEEISKIKDSHKRFNKIYELCNKTKECKVRRKGNNENNAMDPLYKAGCDFKQPKFKKEGLKISIEEEGEEKRNLSPEEVRNIFIAISEKNLRFLGFDKRYSLPEWMIITNLLVCPPQVRPQVSADESQICQDTLTHQYIKIIQANNNLLNEYRKEDQILSLFDRLKGKEGRIRGSLMGKRVNFSARSVISPDPNISVDEVGIPLQVAMTLTFPVIVNDLNKEELQKYVNNGPKKYPGANKVTKANGDSFTLKRAKIILKNGDIVERHLINGDFVILNRQPSLHKMSMMGHRVRILPALTFRLNLSATTPYNADFDGDEMNIHAPQDYETISEVRNIMHVEKQIISPQSDKPIMGIVQDSLLGAKIFTQRDTFLTIDDVFSLVNWIKDFDIRKIPKPCILKPKILWTGKQIFSLILPEELNLEKYRERDTFLTIDEVFSLVNWIKDFNIRKIPNPCILKPKILWTGKQIFSLILPEELNLEKYREETPDELQDKLNILDNFVQIRKGHLIQGIICKSTIGPSSDGIIKNLSPKKAVEFLNNCQKLINNFLLLKGWTVGVSDLICNKELNEEIETMLKDNKDYIKELEDIIFKNKKGKIELQPGKTKLESFETKVNEHLNNIRQNAGKLIQNSLDNKNHLKNMVSAGSKGKAININQIMSFVGQENVEGKRIPLNFDQRTLPHFKKNDFEPESRGFIQNSFLKGLNPSEFFFHAMSGREGIIDTAVKTSEIGYTERRLMKSLEDIIIAYDYTVRDSNGNIIQIAERDKDENTEKDSNENKNQNTKREKGENTKKDSNKNTIQILYEEKEGNTKKDSNENKNQNGEKEKEGNICPGEMVGSIASQSIGERITQMTLNTFHLAGVSSANVTLGVPRLKEILNVSKSIKSPSMTIHLKEKSGDKKYSDKEIYNLIQKIENIPISKVITSYKIYYQPDIRKAVENEDQKIIDEYLEIIEDDLEEIEQNISPWVLRIVLNKKYSNVYFNLVKDIEKRIQQELDGNVFIMHSTDLDENAKILLIRLKYNPNNNKKEKDKEKEKKEQMSEEKIKEFMGKISEMMLYGLESVDKVNIRDIGFDEITKKKIKEETILETKGTNLLEIFELEEIDYKRTISNDINEMYQVLGIEAARKAIINELRKIFNSYDIDIHNRHLFLLSDYMTHNGNLTPINRFGLNKGKYGPIRKATFEESVKNFLNAGFFSEKDKLKGISENVLVGKLAKFGTGYFDFYENEENENNNSTPYINNDDDNKQQYSPMNPGYGDFKQYNNKTEMKNEYNNKTPIAPQEYKYYSPKVKESPKNEKTNVKYSNPFDNKGMEEEDYKEEAENSDKDE